MSLFNYLSFCSTFCIDTATKQNNFDVYSQQSINNHLFILYKFVLNKHDQMIFQNPNMTSLHVLDNESFKIQLPWQNVVIKMSLFLKIPYNTIRFNTHRDYQLQSGPSLEGGGAHSQK